MLHVVTLSSVGPWSAGMVAACRSKALSQEYSRAAVSAAKRAARVLLPEHGEPATHQVRASSSSIPAHLYPKESHTQTTAED